MPYLLDIPNELLCLVFEDLSLQDLFNLITLCRRLNALAISTICNRVQHPQLGGSICIDDHRIRNGVVRAINLQIPSVYLTQVQCILGQNPSHILKETIHILKSKKTKDLRYFRLDPGFSNPPPVKFMKELIDLFVLISSERGSIGDLGLSTFQVPGGRIARRKPLKPLTNLFRAELTTPLITYPILRTWFIESLNASPVQQFTLGGQVDSTEMIKDLNMTRLEYFILSSGHTVQLTELHKFFVRHSKTIHTLTIDKVNTDQLPKALPIGLVKRLRSLAVSPAYLSSFLPRLPKEGRINLKLQPCDSSWGVEYTNELEDALGHIRKLGAAASKGIATLDITFGHDIETVRTWMMSQLNEMENHVEVTNITSLVIGCWSVNKVKDLVPKWVKGRFPNLKRCAVHCELQGDDAIIFARELSMACQSVEYVTIGWDSRHVIDWMNAKLEKKN